MKKNINSSFSSKRFRNGAYSSVVTVIVLAVILFVNLMVGKLDLKVDTSEEGYFTMSDTTKDFLDTLDREVNIYYLTMEGYSDTMIKDMVDKYDSANKHIHVEEKDFELYPNFVYQYVSEDTNVYPNSVVVEDVASGRSKFVHYYDMAKYSYNSNYQTVLTGYDVEGQITSAIQYVTSENLPKIYTTTGHGEYSLGTYASDYLAKQNIEIEALETLTMEAVPEDCQTLIIQGASKDFTEGEIEKIKAYMNAGGKTIIYLTYVEGEMTNLQSLMAHYGVGTVEGIVLETQSNHMINNLPYMIAPEMAEHEVTKSCIDSSKYVGTYRPIGLTIDSDIRGSVERTPILRTSEDAFSKVDLTGGTFSMEENDIAGPFYLGVEATEEYDGVTSTLLVYSSVELLDDTFMGVSSLGNATLFTDTLNWLVEREDSVLSVPAKEFSQKYLTLTAADVNKLVILLVVLLPVAILTCGGVVWFKRRKK